MHIQKALTRTNYSIIADLYIADFEKNYENFYFVDDVLKLRKIHHLENYPIVDLGSGPGTVIDYILKADKHTKPLIAVDFNEVFCHRMNRKYVHNPYIKVFCEDLTKYVSDQKKESIGIYIASFSIIHIPDEEIDQLFTLINRTLVKRGIFLLSCHRGITKGMEQEPYQKFRDMRLAHEPILMNYMNYFTEQELRQRLLRAHLGIVKMEVMPASRKIGDFEADKVWIIAEKL